MPVLPVPGIGQRTDNHGHVSSSWNTPISSGTPLRLAAATLISGLVLQAPAWGKEQENRARSNMDLPAMLGPLMNDTSVDLELRNFYFNRDFKNKLDDDDDRLQSSRESWVQGARLDLQSGYFANLIGFDASLYGALKLVGDEEKYGSGALRNKTPRDKNGRSVAKQESYDKIGQAYLKSQFGDEGINAHVKAGRMFLDTPLLNDSDSRTTPSSTQGIYGDINFYDVNVYGIFSDKASTKTESGFHSYKNDDGQTWNVGILGASIALDNGLTLQAATGKASNYLKQDFFNSSYNLDLGNKTGLFLDGYFQRAKDDGNKYDGKLDSKLWNVAAQLTFDTLSVMASFQGVIGDAYDYSWDGFRHDDNGLITWNAVQYLDFNKKNEKSWQGRVDYSFENWGVPGLSVMTRYVTGEFKDGKTRKEWERDTDLRYEFKEGPLSGLGITWRNATVRSATSGDAIDENRLIINYTLPII